MASYRTEALVLKKRRLGEADNVLILASPTEGRVDAIAKGVRKTTSRFGGRLEPLSYVRVVMHRGRTFDAVTGVEAIDLHEPLRKEIKRASHAAVVADVLDKVLVRGQSEPRLFALSETTLTAMETPGADLAALTVAFAIKALAMLGLRPSLADCAACGAVVGGSTRFSPTAGGVFCTRCGVEVPDAGVLSADAREALGQLMAGTMAEAAASRLDGAVRDELLAATRTLLLAHVHGRLKSLEFLARLGREGSR